MKPVATFTARAFLAPFAAVATLAGTDPAHAALVTLTSPDNRWRLSSDEFGAHGEGVGGSFAQRDFGDGAGLTGYSWTSSVLLTDGATRQWLASNAGFGVVNTPPIGAGNVISDVTAGNQRTSVFTVPGIANIQVRLTQSVTNSGIFQQYVISNSGATPVDLTFVPYHDVDLDANTFLNDVVSGADGRITVSEGGRFVSFSPSPVGYAGFLAAHRPGSGITGDLNLIAFNNFGIPGANLNQFRDVTGGNIGADWDVDADLMSDTPSDVGYLFQNNLSIPASGSVSLTLSHIPEPAAGLLGLLGIGFTMRRRR